jgi:hypothetical protein
MNRARLKRALGWLALAALLVIGFEAYLSPSMVFDLANMVFCG